MAKFNVAAAKKAGYSDLEIERFIRDNDLEIEGSLQNFGGNILRSGGRLVGDTVGAVANIFNPNLERNTLAQLGSTVLGGVQNLIPGEQGQESKFNNLARGLGERYGITSALRGDFGQAGQDLYRTAYFDPAGVVADVAGLASGVGVAAKGASAAGKLGGASKLSRFGTGAMRFSDAIDPVSYGMRGVGRVANKGIRGMDEFSRSYATADLGNPVAASDANRILKNINYQSIDPVTGRQVTRPMQLADLIAEGNLYGRSVDDVVRYSDELGRTFDQIADNPNLPVRVENITAPLDKLIESTQQALKDFPGDRSYSIQLKELTRQRNNLASKARNGIIPGNEALRLRRTLESVTSDAASRGVQLKPGEMLAKQKAVSGLRSGLRQSDPRLTGLGKRMQSIGFDSPGKQGPVLKAFSGNESRRMVRNPITLGATTKLGFGAALGAGFGGPIGAVTGAGLAGLTNNLLSSPAGIRTISQGGQKMAQGLGTAKRYVAPRLMSLQRNVVRPSTMISRQVLESPTQQQQQYRQVRPSVNQSSYSPSFSFYNRPSKNKNVEIAPDYLTDEQKRRYGFK